MDPGLVELDLSSHTVWSSTLGRTLGVGFLFHDTTGPIWVLLGKIHPPLGVKDLLVLWGALVFIFTTGSLSVHLVGS